MIKYLLKAKGWSTAGSLASVLEVSPRTVKNYVSELNRLSPDLILSSPNGYMARREGALALLQDSQENKKSIPQSNKERTLYIILLLLRAPRPLDMYELCDTMFISMSTLRIVLKRVKQQLASYQLKLFSLGDQIGIEGDEQSRRQMLRSIIFSETNTVSFDINTIQDIFDNIDTDFAINAMNEILWENKYYVTDYSAYNMVLHIVIAIDRNLSAPVLGRRERDSAGLPAFLPSHVREMAEKLSAGLEEYYGIVFQPDDVLEFALLFYTRATSILLHEVDESNLENYIGRDCALLIQELLDRLNHDYGIELTKAESKISFSLHIKSLLVRAKTQHFSRNPLTESIKTSCPMIYDVAVCLSSIISESVGVNLIDDEIAYIAFHIGNAIELQRAYDSRISVVLNCPTYYNMNHDLSERLTERFGNDIIIEDITVSEAQLDHYEQVDLILSTVPLKPELSVSNIQIHPFLTMADSSIVEKAILRIKEEKKQAQFISEIRKIILPDFYEHLNKPMSKEETLHYMCGRLTDAGFATGGYEKAVLEREQLSSTEFTNFAIPHAMSMEEHRSCMYILINDQPIPWGSNEVQLVIMLCFNAADRQVFYTVFEPLSVYLLNRPVIQRILGTKSYEEFIEIISDAQ